MRSRRSMAPPVVAAILGLLVASGCTGSAGTAPSPAAIPVVVEAARSVDIAENGSPTTAVASPSEDTTSSDFTLPDLTAPPLDPDRLQTLLPPSLQGSTAEPDIRVRTNGDLISAAHPDQADEVEDLIAFDRLAGVAATYETESGTAHVWIDLLGDHDAAHGYLQDAAGDVAKGMGLLRLGAPTPAAVDDFPIDLGDQAIGLILDYPDGTSETAVLFRMGRLVFMSSLLRSGGDYRVAAEYQASELAEAALDALVRGVAASPIRQSGAPDTAYEFVFDLDFATASELLTIRAEGRRIAEDVACRVTVLGPSTEIDREIRRVGGVMWAREPSREWTPVGDGNLLDAALIRWCPAWPPDVDAAGLRTIAEGEAAELASAELGRLLGYRGDAELLASALGVPLRGVEVSVMNAWLTEDEDFLVELNVIASGPPVSLTPLVGPWPAPVGDTAELELHHRIVQLDDPDPIRPPG